MWAPCSVASPVGTVTIATDYPFGDTANVELTASGSASVPVYLRIPSWSDGTMVTVNGGTPEKADAGMCAVR